MESTLPNFFAYFALFAWPLVCVALFVRLPVEKAAIWSLLGGYLLLPSGMSVQIPFFQPLDKFNIPVIATFLLCWMKGTQVPASRRSWVIYVLAAVFVISPVFTSLNNSYELHVGDRSIPGFYPLDGAKYAFHNLLTLLPFFVGMRFLSSSHGRVLLLRAIPLAALCYSVPMLFEVRFSPQLARLVYGFYPQSFFIQQIRAGGFRPVVFLTQGLEAALFVSLALIASTVAARSRSRFFRVPAAAAAGYLAVVLLLCKTLGAAIYAIIAVPIVVLTKPRTWLRISCAIALLACAYPLLRGYDVIPVHRIVDLANAVSADRSASFATRVKNEDMLLNKANDKPIFGWGTWGRHRVYDRDSGADISLTDGEWIIQLGMFGWVGYLSLFGLFATALMRSRTAMRGATGEEAMALGGLGLLLAINLLDLIPNANLLPITFLTAGSVAGCVRARSMRTAARPVVAAAPSATAVAC